jgi:hypothetical protein
VGVQEPDHNAKLLHFTLGGPWFKGEECSHSAQWFWAREKAMQLWQQP